MTPLEAAWKLVEMKRAIEADYGRIIQKVDEYTRQIDKLMQQKLQLQNPNNKFLKGANNTIEFINDKIEIIKKKQGELKAYAEEQLRTRLAAAQSWMDNTTAEIEKQIKSQTEQYVTVIHAFSDDSIENPNK